MGFRGSVVTAGVAFLASLVGPVSALDTPNERVTLTGLTGVHVVVEELGAEAEGQGLSRAGLQEEVERRLRRAGLRVYTAAEALESLGRPTLKLRVVVGPAGVAPGVYVYSVDLTLRQQIRLVRSREIESFAVTWSENRDVGALEAGRLSAVRDVVRARVDQFLEAWKTVRQATTY